MASVEKEFCGRVVFVTGSSSGIGADTAVEFAKRGAKLAITGLDENNLRITADKCIAAGVPKNDVLGVTGDLTKEQDVDHIVESILKHFGTIHILVNNAGMFVLGSMESTSLKDYDTMHNVNVRTVFMVTKKTLSHIVDNKGSIVNVSSVCGTRPFHSCLAYSMSKAALNQLTQCLALELAPKGVRVNAVTPGVIDTPLFQRPGSEIAGQPEKKEEFYESCAFAHPLGRIGSVEEVSKVICFLASDAASFVTGALVPIDGGRHCTVALPKQ